MRYIPRSAPPFWRLPYSATTSLRQTPLSDKSRSEDPIVQAVKKPSAASSPSACRAPAKRTWSAPGTSSTNVAISSPIAMSPAANATSKSSSTTAVNSPAKSSSPMPSRTSPWSASRRRRRSPNSSFWPGRSAVGRKGHRHRQPLWLRGDGVGRHHQRQNREIPMPNDVVMTR